MNKIEFARRECRRMGVKYQIKRDALFILSEYTITRRRYYKQVCFNLYKLSFEQITALIEEVKQ